MNLQQVTIPGAIGDLHFAIGSYTGFDRLLPLLPRSWQRDIIARRILAHLKKVGVRLEGPRRVTFYEAGLDEAYEIVIVGENGLFAVRPWIRDRLVDRQGARYP